MAIMLTTTYQKVSTIYLTYGEIRTYARYGMQSTELNETYWQIKCTYYTYQAGGVTFSSGRAGLDGSWKDYGYTTMPYGETTLIEEFRTTAHNSDGSSPTRALPTAWSASFGGGGTTSVDVVFPKINRYPVLVSGNNFTDSTNPIFTITAYGTYPIMVKLEAGGYTELVRRDLTNKNSQVYTMELTPAERKTLRNLSPDGRTLAVRFTVCAMSGNTALSYSYRDYTMTIVKKPARIKINGEFKNGYPYVRVNGEWKEAKPYIRVNNDWKEEI